MVGYQIGKSTVERVLPVRPGNRAHLSVVWYATSMTIFGVDVSEHQNGMSLAQAGREGVQFAIVRTTDGTYKDSCYRSHIIDAENGGLVTAAYHYLRRPTEGTSISSQVDASIQVMGNKKRPIWLDCETSAGLSVGDIRTAKKLFEERGVRVIGCYSYVPWWEGKIFGGEPDSHEFGKFWVAAYGNNRAGIPSAIYPGDNDGQWTYPLGNQNPVLWQYGSRAKVSGFEVDINAYKGTKSQVRDLFYGSTTGGGDDIIDDMSDIRITSIINPSKKFKPTDLVAIIDATGWENRQLLLAICKSLKIDANKVIADAKAADNR